MTQPAAAPLQPPPADAPAEGTLCVLYNDTCPLCRAEIETYRRQSQAAGLDLRYDPLDRAGDWGMDADTAARRLHVRQDGRVLSGLPAFRAIWSALPRWRWLAWLTGLPGVGWLATRIYDHILAPPLYRAHLRRQARRARR
jgi:predicted DCC family thiol-disulfide oxidoreductase YuxK